MNPSATLTTTWREQAKWSGTATSLKKQIEHIRSWALALLVAAVTLETLSLQLGIYWGAHSVGSRALAVIGAILMAITGVLHNRSQLKDRMTMWTRARSASEALKEHVYRYLTHTGLYDTDDPDRVLSATVARITSHIKDLEAQTTPIPIPERTPPPSLEIEAYVTKRVEEQISGYYRPRSKALARRRDQWRMGQNILLFGGAVFCGIATFFPSAGLAAWVGVLTTITGAIGTHIEGTRFDQLIIGYQATALRLEFLRNEWRDSLSKKELKPHEKTDFINRCEEAISVENQAWMAEWITNPVSLPTLAK